MQLVESELGFGRCTSLCSIYVHASLFCSLQLGLGNAFTSAVWELLQVHRAEFGCRPPEPVFPINGSVRIEATQTMFLLELLKDTQEEQASSALPGCSGVAH